MTRGPSSPRAHERVAFTRLRVAPLPPASGSGITQVAVHRLHAAYDPLPLLGSEPTEPPIRLIGIDVGKIARHASELAQGHFLCPPIEGAGRSP